MPGRSPTTTRLASTRVAMRPSPAFRRKRSARICAEQGRSARAASAAATRTTSRSRRAGPPLFTHEPFRRAGDVHVSIPRCDMLRRPLHRKLTMNAFAEQSVEGLLREFAARRLSPVEAWTPAPRGSRPSTAWSVGSRPSASSGRARRRARRRRRGLGAGPLARGDSVRGQGPVRLRRRPDGVRLADVRRPRPRPRRRGGAPGARGGRDPRRARPRRTSSRGGSRPSTRALGSARNPWALERVSGGSSGGSAVVLAADEVPLALGSDTGGSIRVPAAFCGVVGLKPTYGRISGAGAWPLARSLDHPGPMATTPADAALLLEAIAGVDPADPATVGRPARRRARRARARARRPRRRALPRPRISSRSRRTSRRCSTATLRTLERGRRTPRRGARFPRPSSILPTFRTIQSAEALDTHRRAGLYPARRDEYGAGRPRPARRCGRGDARAVPRGVRRPAAHPGSVRARSSARATSSSRR